MQPRPSSRINSLEQRASTIEAKIIELSNDTAEELRVLTNHVDQGFKQAHAYIQENIEAVMATKEDISKLDARIDRVDERLDRIETTMSTKEDITAMEVRLVDTIKQLWQQRPSQ